MLGFFAPNAVSYNAVVNMKSIAPISGQCRSSLLYSALQIEVSTNHPISIS